jgi:metallo-beta-lactamase superfamily protein
MPLEDDFSDILKKARTGQGLSVGDVTRLTGLPGGDITAMERGDTPRDRMEVRALAKALGLRSSALEAIALDKWEPVPQQPPAWVETVHGSINGYGVQGYILYDDGEAIVIDTAYNAPAMLAALKKRGLIVVAICLTHGHTDHADGIDLLLQHREVPVGSHRIICSRRHRTAGRLRSGAALSAACRRRAIRREGSVIEWMIRSIPFVLSVTRCLPVPSAGRIRASSIRYILILSARGC